MGSDRFAVNRTISLPGGVAGVGALALHGHTGYVVAVPAPSTGTSPATDALWRTTNGSTWAMVPDPCGSDLYPDSVSPLTDATVIMLCAGQGAAGSSQKAIFRSTDGGSTWTAAAAPEFSAGDGGTVAASSVSIVSVATSSAAAEVYRSTNGGSTSTTSFRLDDGGIGWGDFGYTTPAQGILVHAPASRIQGGGDGQVPYPATLFITHDAGSSWHPVAF